MVDVLSRAGELEEAISVAREIKGNAFIAWKAILAGCKQYNDIQRSLYVSQQLEKYAPNDTSTHVLMANIYATAGMKEERDAIRRMIDEVFITKNLRVCLDCHTAIKLISKHTERTIKIKDASRLHTMTDGVCDCGDQY
jgi:hypothetical protein